MSWEWCPKHQQMQWKSLYVDFIKLFHIEDNLILEGSLFISQPHFLNADPKFVESVFGLKANKNKHDYVLDFEPVCF